MCLFPGAYSELILKHERIATFLLLDEVHFNFHLPISMLSVFNSRAASPNIYSVKKKTIHAFNGFKCVKTHVKNMIGFGVYNNTSIEDVAA